MDKFTESYIEMVINNKQIQALCKYNKGDWFWNGEKPYLYCKSGLGSSNPHDYKWLPTLEQLFKIITPSDSISAFWWFENWFSDMYGSKNIRGNIKEYILQYIMQRGYGKYRKEWNGKEWEEINGS